MGSNFDWQGISQGLGDIGENVSTSVQRGKAEKADKARKRLQAAEIRLNAARATAKSEDDPELQAALKEYEAAVADVTDQPGFRVPRKTIGGSPTQPAQTVTIGQQRPEEGGLSNFLTPPSQQTIETAPAKPAVPGKEILTIGPLDRQAISFRDFAKSIGLNLTPEQDQLYGDRPWSEVMDMNTVARKAGKPLFPQLTENDDELVANAHQLILNYTRAIAAATTPVERQAAVDAARQWKISYLQQYPQLANLFPDFMALGQKFDREAEAVQKRTAASQRYDTWKALYRDAVTRYRAAFKATDPTELMSAVAEYNAVVAEGKKNGFVDRGAIDPQTELKRWYEARRDDILKANIDLREKQLRLAKLQQDLAEGVGGGGGSQESYRLQIPNPKGGKPHEGIYVITNYHDKRGNLTKQVVVDSRTGKVITNEILEKRAAQGDKEAEAILGYNPKAGLTGEQAQAARPVTDLSDAELGLEETKAQTFIDQYSTAPNVSAAKIRAAQKRLDEVRAEMGRRFRGIRPTARPAGTDRPAGQVNKGAGNPPTANAGRVWGVWRQSKKPVPAKWWAALNQDEKDWLTRMGVQHQ